MSVNTVSTFLATGAVLLGAGLITLLVIWIFALISDRARTVLATISASFEGFGLRLAWVMALVATAGSLYFSEVAHFTPCELCWYQRIAMYPLALVLGIAVVRRDQAVRRYVLPLAISGAVIAAYHYTIQQFPDLSVTACSTTTPCTSAWVWKFGFVSIPLMALVSFATIVAVLLLDRPGRRAPAEDLTPTTPLEDP